VKFAALMLPTAARSPALLGLETLATELNGTKPAGKAAQAVPVPTVSVTEFEVLAA
jgi:hypothetical protein